MVDIFSLREASMFARALAGGNGIHVEEARGPVVPVSMKDGTIIIGEPSIYDADEYMGNLHREISKQMKDMKFFYDIDDKDEFAAAARDILQSQRTEYNRRGEFQGRDKILSKHYADTCKKNGGITKVIERVEESSLTLAAMVAIGNDLRNDWQGYQSAEVSNEVQQEINRLSFLRDEWLKLDSLVSLETLIKRIQHENTDDGDGSRGETSDQGDDSRGDEGGSQPDGKDSESSGENQDSEESDSQESGGESGTEGGESEAGDSGSDNRELHGDRGGQQETEEESGDSGTDNPNTGRGTSTEEQGDGENTKREAEDSTGEQGPEGSVGDDHGVGATKASQSLEDMGFTKKPVEYYRDAETSSVPYMSMGDRDLNEVTIDSKNISRSGLLSTITKEIGSFVLSKKMKKYFVAMKQTGYAYGLKRGKLCSKNLYRAKTGGAEPPIFKKKLATKVEQDAAIFILGDCSGSMSNHGRYVTSAACQVSMSEVLQSMSIPHMMMQFSTFRSGRNHYVMKTFAENRVSRETLLKRYASRSIQMECNADGEAVVAASQYLAKMPQKNKLLIVLSDGEPAYRYGDEQFLKDVVSKIEESKAMNIIGVGINTDVSRYYTYSKKIVQLKDLESVLLSILKDVIIK